MWFCDESYIWTSITPPASYLAFKDLVVSLSPYTHQSPFGEQHFQTNNMANGRWEYLRPNDYAAWALSDGRTWPWRAERNDKHSEYSLTRLLHLRAALCNRDLAILFVVLREALCNRDFPIAYEGPAVLPAYEGLYVTAISQSRMRGLLWYLLTRGFM